MAKTLQNQVFEIDIEESEVDGAQDCALVAQKEKGIFKEGYLTKAPFHSENSSMYGSKVSLTVYHFYCYHYYHYYYLLSLSFDIRLCFAFCAPPLLTRAGESAIL